MNFSPKSYLFSAAGLIAVFAVFSAGAQTAALGNIAGVVRDSSGAVVPGVSVAITDTLTGASRTTTTDSEGHYAATFLQPGIYEVILGGGSFGRVDQKNVSVTVGDTRTVDEFVCPGTAAPGTPPRICTGSAPNAPIANDQDAFSERLPLKPS